MLHRSQLKKHIANFHPSSTLCHICGQNFESVNKFRYHRDFGHLEFMTCDLCGRFKTQSKVVLWKHMQRHLFFRDEKNKRFFCEFCGYSCFFKNYLDKHLKTHGVGKVNKEKFDALESRRKFQCDKCFRRYVDRRDLAFHQKYKHEGFVRQFKHSCELCGFKFYKRNKYEKHLLSKAHKRKAENFHG